MKTISGLREEYINEFRAVQQKRVKRRDDFIVLVLLLAYFVDYIETQNESKMFLVAPFIPKIINIDKPKVVVKAVEEALDLKGKLAEHVVKFKKINEKTLESLNNIIPQIDIKNKSKGESRRLIDLENEARTTEVGNAGNLIVNEFVLNKTMKQWNTQRDSRVRKTLFHSQIDRKVVKINEQFSIGDSKAMFPSDSSLPPFDRYGCRCYLTYYN